MPNLVLHSLVLWSNEAASAEWKSGKVRHLNCEHTLTDSVLSMRKCYSQANFRNFRPTRKDWQCLTYFRNPLEIQGWLLELTEWNKEEWTALSGSKVPLLTITIRRDLPIIPLHFPQSPTSEPMAIVTSGGYSGLLQPGAERRSRGCNPVLGAVSSEGTEETWHMKLENQHSFSHFQSKIQRIQRQDIYQLTLFNTITLLKMENKPTSCFEGFHFL